MALQIFSNFKPLTYQNPGCALDRNCYNTSTYSYIFQKGLEAPVKYFEM